MRYAVSPISAAAERPQTADFDPGTRSIRFGDVLFHMTEQPRWGGLAKAARGAGAALKRLSHATPRERLHMVVQKGRLFQQAHGDVPVLLDKGRYLVVDLDPRKARKWDQGHRPCFAIRPLPETAVAFDAPALRASPNAGLPWVQTLVERITRALFEANLKRLVAFPTRFSTSSHYAAAAKLARTQLKTLGFETRLSATLPCHPSHRSHPA